ncbi:DUF2142 domain-containing protein [Patescibacteria group bacterium]
MKKIFASSFFILLFWTLFVPIFEFPDEQAHFARISLESDNNKKPFENEADLSTEIAKTEKIMGTFRNKKGNNNYTYHPENKLEFSNNTFGLREQEIIDLNTEHNKTTFIGREAARYPFLYYSYENIFYNLVKNESILTRVIVSRLGSVLLGSLLVLVAYRIGEELFGDHHLSTILASLVALQPMMVFVSSGINPDVMHNLWFSVIILFALKFIRYDFVGDVTFYLGLFIGLDMLTKPQAYIAIPVVIFAFLVRMIVKKQIFQTISYFFILAFVAFLAGYYVEGNNIIKIIRSGNLPYLRSVENPHPSSPSLIAHAKYSIGRLLNQNTVWYWGVFKWLGVVLPRYFWWIANRVVAISFIGTIIGIFRKVNREKLGQLSILIFSTIFYIFAIFWFDWKTVEATTRKVGIQARYYFPTLVAHMALLAFGISNLIRKEKIQKTLLISLVLFFVTLQLGGIYTIAKSYYDTSSIITLFNQASQYKPIFAKSYFWVAWVGLYLAAIGNLVLMVVKPGDTKELT